MGRLKTDNIAVAIAQVIKLFLVVTHLRLMPHRLVLGHAGHIVLLSFGDLFHSFVVAVDLVIEGTIQSAQSEWVIQIHTLEDHYWQLHHGLEAARMRETTHVDEHLHMLLIDDVRREQNFLRVDRGAEESINVEQSLEGLLPDAMVDRWRERLVHQSERVQIMLLCDELIVLLHLALQATQVVKVLHQEAWLDDVHAVALVSGLLGWLDMVVEHARAAQDDVQALRDIHQCLATEEGADALLLMSHLELDLLEGDALVDWHVLRWFAIFGELLDQFVEDFMLTELQFDLDFQKLLQLIKVLEARDVPLVA
jgi:hypothetical protein